MFILNEINDYLVSIIFPQLCVLCIAFLILRYMPLKESSRLSSSRSFMIAVAICFFTYPAYLFASYLWPQPHVSRHIDVGSTVAVALFSLVFEPWCVIAFILVLLRIVIMKGELSSSSMDVYYGLSILLIGLAFQFLYISATAAEL